MFRSLRCMLALLCRGAGLLSRDAIVEHFWRRLQDTPTMSVVRMITQA
jgi:hypothetical protein